MPLHGDGFRFALPILRTAGDQQKPAEGSRKAVFVRSNFSNAINLICPVQSSPRKYTSSRPTQISPTTSPVPGPPRGAYRDRHGRWAGNAVDAAAPAALIRIAGRALACERSAARQTNDAEAYGKSVWFWHPWLVSNRWRFSQAQPGLQNRQFADDGGKRNSSPGRARHKP